LLLRHPVNLRHAFSSVLGAALLCAATNARAQAPERTPAQAADPPPIPAPAAQAPLSTSGTDVAPPVPLLPTSPALVPGAPGSGEARRHDLDTRIAVDEARLKTLEDDLGPLRHLKVQGYVQLQYRVQSVDAAASPNLVGGRLPDGISSNDVIAKADGTTTNAHLFRLRRTRLRTLYETDVVRVFLQADLFPGGGPTATQGTIARNAEATGIAHWTADLKTELTGGLFQVPFRSEVVESSMYRPWIERTFASQSLFPLERDLGVHAKTIYGSGLVALDVGVLNGQRLGERTFVLQPDLDGGKDFFATASLKIGHLSGSLAGYLGRGQVVDATALRVKNFHRRGANLGLEYARTLTEKLGETKLVAELLFGTNMDTGALVPFALPAIPKSFTDDVKDLHERGLYVRVDQDVTKWGIAGFRFDTYTTDSSIANNGRDTYTLMLGGRFSKHLRLVNEASYTVDNLHPEGAAAPSKHVYGYTAWLQGSFF
jgi:DMSO/TMAO reductase YedYZ molybdopterin-dependent catalytic subunit